MYGRICMGEAASLAVLDYVSNWDHVRNEVYPPVVDDIELRHYHGARRRTVYIVQ